MKHARAFGAPQPITHPTPFMWPHCLNGVGIPHIHSAHTTAHRGGSTLGVVACREGHGPRHLSHAVPGRPPLRDRPVSCEGEGEVVPGTIVNSTRAEGTSPPDIRAADCSARGSLGATIPAADHDHPSSARTGAAASLRACTLATADSPTASTRQHAPDLRESGSAQAARLQLARSRTSPRNR